MMVTLIFVSMGLLALAGLLLLAKGRAGSISGGGNLSEQLRSVDIDAFRNLIDPNEEQYLRAHLAAAMFRKVQRQRVLAAIAYVSGAAGNASILMRIGDAARHSPDPSMAAAGEKLVDTAIRLRLYAFQAMAILYLGLVLPGVRISPAAIAESYEQMTRLVVVLGCFQHAPQGVAAAL
ncbi:MAG: hypothetical protein WB421_04160 [Terriglobales bacterium]